MALLLEAAGPGRAIQRLALEPGRNQFPARPGVHYRLVDENGQAVQTQASVKRVGNDLIIDDLPDKRVVEIDEFFTRCTPQAACVLDTANLGGSPGGSITPDSQPVAALTDGSFVMVPSAQAQTTPLADATTGVSTTGKAVGIGLAALGLGAAGGGGGGGGGGGSDSGGTAPAAQTVPTRILTTTSGSAFPVIEGEGTPGAPYAVSLTLSNGQKLVFNGTVGADGHFSVDTHSQADQFPQGIAGNVLVDARVINGLAPSDATAVLQVDPTPLTVTLADRTSGDVATGVIVWDIVFNKPVSDFTLSDIRISGAADARLTGSGNAYALTVTPTANAQGTVSVTVPEGAATDAFGHQSATAVASQGVDTRGLALSITDDSIATPNGQYTVTFTFARPVSDFTIDDVSVTGAAHGPLVGSGSTYTMTVTPTANTTGTVAIAVAAGTVTDNLGETNTHPSNYSRGYDAQVPSLVISDSAAGAASGPFTVTFTFSEPVTGFGADDIHVTGAASVGPLMGSGSVYTLLVTPPANAVGDIQVSVASGAAIDNANNPSTAPQPLTQHFDTVPPTVTITDNVGDATSGATVLYTFTFSEPVNGFTASDVQVSGGTAGRFSGSGSVYTLEVTAPPNTEGDFRVSIPAGAVTDAAGNPNVASSVSTQHYESIPPTATITDDVPGTATGNVTYSIDFSEPVTALSQQSVLVSGGSVVSFAGSGTHYTLVAAPTPGVSGNLVVQLPAGAVSDLHGNPSTPASDSQPYVPPLTLTLTDNVPQAVANGPITFTFAFNRPVSGFDLTDISIVGAPLLGLALRSTDQQVYTLTVQPPSNLYDQVTVSVAAGAVTDAYQSHNNAVSDTQMFLLVDNNASSPESPLTARAQIEPQTTILTTQDVLDPAASPSSMLPGSETVSHDASHGASPMQAHASQIDMENSVLSGNPAPAGNPLLADSSGLQPGMHPVHMAVI